MSQTAGQSADEVKKACLTALADGNRQLTMTRRYLLRALDETWIRAVEEALPVLDTVIRNPQRQLREKEKVLPIELSRNITSRSVRHLTQHTNLIAKVEGDVITPSKILNVYSDETALTYENKFVNTLLLRLYTFVHLRCDTVRERGLDAKVTTLELDDTFSVGDTRGKVHLTLEYEEKPEEGLPMAADARYTDRWQRAQHIRSVTAAYLHSDFVRTVGQNYVRPPVIRTNAILKNKDLRQCLALWEFLDGYENIGYTFLVDRQEGSLPDGAESPLMEGVSALYIRFLDDMRAAVFAEAEPTATEVPQAVPAEEPKPQPAPEGENALRERILREVQIALAADELYRPAEKTPAEEQETLFGRFRFRWSFLARLSQASDTTRGYYAAVKEALLSYRKVNARISWNYETFTFGRRRCARIAVHGKTLLLYLALSPAAYNRDRYHFTDASDTAAYRDVPLRLPIRSPRALKYALELIGEVMRVVGATLLPEEKRPARHLLPPHRTLRELIADRLIRPLTGTEVPEEDSDPKTTAEETPAGESPAETTQANALPPAETEREPDAEGIYADTDDGDSDAEGDVSPAGIGGDSYRTRFPYRYSFEARLSLGDETMRARYTALAEALTSYAGVRRRTTWHYDAFYHGRGTCARIGVRGKTVSLYLALDPQAYSQSKYHFTDVSEITLYRGTPMQLRVRSDRALHLACELIRLMMEHLGATPLSGEKRRTKPLAVAPKTREELLTAGLIRFDGDAPGDTKETERPPEPTVATDKTGTGLPTEAVPCKEAGTETEEPIGTVGDVIGDATDETVGKASEDTSDGTASETADGASDELTSETAGGASDETTGEMTGNTTGETVTAAPEDPCDTAPAAEPAGTGTTAPSAEKPGFFRRLFSRRKRRGNGKAGS